MLSQTVHNSKNRIRVQSSACYNKCKAIYEHKDKYFMGLIAIGLHKVCLTSKFYGSIFLRNKFYFPLLV
jgi:hypothetical protein